MTYGALKQRIFALLDVDGREETMAGSMAAHLSPLIPDTINETARKVMLVKKNIIYTDTMFFTKGAVGVQTLLPDHAFGIFAVEKGGRLIKGEAYMTVGRSLILLGEREGEFTVSYYAFPEQVTSETEERRALPFDEMTADIVAYGAAGALSLSVYPSDAARYMRLMTEYDERLVSHSPRTGERMVQNRFFGGKRGI